MLFDALLCDYSLCQKYRMGEYESCMADLREFKKEDPENEEITTNELAAYLGLAQASRAVDEIGNMVGICLHSIR